MGLMKHISSIRTFLVTFMRFLLTQGWFLVTQFIRFVYIRIFCFCINRKKHFHNYQIDHIYRSFLEFLQPKQQLMRLDDEYFVHSFLFLIIYSLHAFVYQMVFLRVILRDLTNFILRILIQKTPQDITIFLYFVQFRIWVKLLL